MPFKYLTIGARFTFTHSALSCPRGPWIKTSPRKYREADSTTDRPAMECQVGDWLTDVTEEK